MNTDPVLAYSRQGSTINTFEDILELSARNFQSGDLIFSLSIYPLLQLFTVVSWENTVFRSLHRPPDLKERRKKEVKT